MSSIILYLAVFVGAITEHSVGLKSTIFCKPCRCHWTPGEMKANCSNLGLREIPSSIPSNITTLDMSKNIVSDLPPSHLTRFHNLRHLNYSKNNLSSLGVDSFVGVITLESLLLHGNMLLLNDKAYPKGVFRQQKLLVSLDISKNVIKTEGVYPAGALSDLISLQSLYVDGVTNATFGEGFAKLGNLTILSLSGSRGYCAVYNLFNHSFINTPSLTFLDISKCRILDIQVDTFAPLRSIDILDVSENMYLGFDKLGDSLFGLRFSPLRVLKINRIVNTFAIGVVLETHHFRYFREMNVKVLYGNNNRIELINNMVPSQLAGCEIISMTNGRFTWGEYLLALDTMTNLTAIYFNDQYISDKIPLPGSERWEIRTSKGGTYRHAVSYAIQESTVLQKDPGAGGQQIAHLSKGTNFHPGENPYYANVTDLNGYDSTIHYMTENSVDSMLNTSNNLYDSPAEIDAADFFYRFTIPLPPNLYFVNASNSKLNYHLHNINFSKNRIKQIDLSNNLLTRWIGPVHECKNLEILDMSSNYCEAIASTFLKFATGLKVLNISKNFLATSLQNDVKGQLFFNQTNLEILRIAHNIIRKLPPSVFSRLTNLKFLDLSWNMMETWSADISHMTNLQLLDLAKNRLDVVPRNLRQQIDTLMKYRKDKFHIKVNTNYLKCDCESLESLEWMLKPYIIIDDLSESECRHPDGSVTSMCDLKDVVLKLRQKCKTTIPLIISAVVGLLFFLFVAICGIIYRYRWNLRYLYYTTRRKYRGYQRLTEEEYNFTYDAFVSYADEDRTFVVDNMRTVLEERFGLRLCIHQRDFMVGEPITANIINAIKSSRKTIVILSPDFVGSSWCEYEVRMAKLESIHTGRDLLCVIWYADVPDREAITGDLLEEILNDTYIKYPGEEQEQELFWATLKESLEY